MNLWNYVSGVEVSSGIYSESTGSGALMKAAACISRGSRTVRAAVKVWRLLKWGVGLSSGCGSTDRKITVDYAASNE
jgi:hypothetical protein